VFSLYSLELSSGTFATLLHLVAAARLWREQWTAKQKAAEQRLVRFIGASTANGRSTAKLRHRNLRLSAWRVIRKSESAVQGGEVAVRLPKGDSNGVL
jgi:hypothetical protein